MNNVYETEEMLEIQADDFKVSRVNRRRKTQKKKDKSFKKALNLMKYQLEEF
jgi:hypothetical protein